MDESSVLIPELSAGVPIDVATMLDGKQRQIVAIGDPTTAGKVAPVDATNGLGVQIIPALPAGNNNIGDVDVASLPALPAGTNAIGKLAANAGVNIGDIGSITTAIIPGFGPTNLGKREDDPHVSGDTGVAMLAVRHDANTSMVGSDGDYALPQVDASGALKVAITAGAGSGGTSMADEAAFTVGATSATPVAGLYEVSEDTLTDTTIGAIGIDSARNVKTHEQYAPHYEDNVNNVAAIQHLPVAGAAYSALDFGIFGTDVDLAVKATPGNLLSLYATNANATVRWLQLHNKASAPASTNVPILSLPIPAGTINNPGFLRLTREDLGQSGRYCDIGVSIGISTAEGAFTAATTTDHDYYGQYV